MGYSIDWYPGMGEVILIDRMSPGTRRILQDAASKDPDFVREYLLPVLEEEDPESAILSDFYEAVAEEGLYGLSDFDQVDLGMGFYKKLKKIHKKVAKKIVPKAVLKAHEKVKKVGKKVWKQYGNTIISVAGAVLAPFTGGASVAAAAAIVAANTAYQKKRAADAAKKAGKKQAAVLQAEAKAAEAEVRRQLSDFYNKNVKWFQELGVDRAKWDGLSIDAQVELIRAGTEGRLPRTPPAQLSAPSPAGPAPVQQAAPSAEAGTPSPGGGWGSSGGGGGGGYSPDSMSASGGFTPPGYQASQEPQKLATAGMLGSPVMLVGIGVALAAILMGNSKKSRSRRSA